MFNAMGTYLLLYEGELLQVALQEGHLLLLSLAVAVADDVVVLLLDLVKLNLELNNLCTCHKRLQRRIKSERATYLLATVLQITHKRLLDAIKLRQLDANCLARPLQILSGLSQVLTAFNASGGCSECALRKCVVFASA